MRILFLVLFLFLVSACATQSDQLLAAAIESEDWSTVNNIIAEQERTASKSRSCRSGYVPVCVNGQPEETCGCERVTGTLSGRRY